MRITPRVSVLLPVRDEAEFLGDALASLSAQTFDDFEVVVVDDGSTDGSVDIARRHARVDRRFRVVTQRAAGLVAALERARAEARGGLLARMDGDDLALPERLRLQVDALEKDELGACGGGIEYFADDGVRDGSRRYERWINSLVTADAAARDVFVECPIAHPTLLARREVVADAGGYCARPWPEDYDLVLRLWGRGERFRNVADVVLRWRDHPTRHSRNQPAFAQAAFVRCKVAHLRATLLRGWDAVVIWGAGPVGKSFARELRRVGTTVAAFVDVDPRKVGHAVYGVPVVPVEGAPRFSAAFALGAVAGEEARERIRAMVAAQGRRDGIDFVAVA